MSLSEGQVLTTARMTLADVADDDFAATYAMDQDPLVARYLGDGQPEMRPLSEYRDSLRARLNSWTGRRFHMWVMRPHDSNTFLGWVMLKPIKNTPRVELGYRTPQASWGNGYATEAARAVLKYGFRVAGFDEITAVTHPDNTASQHVLSNVGLQRDGTLNYNGRGEIPFFRLSKQEFLKAHGN